MKERVPPTALSGPSRRVWEELQHAQRALDALSREQARRLLALLEERRRIERILDLSPVLLYSYDLALSRYLSLNGNLGHGLPTAPPGGPDAAVVPEDRGAMAAHWERCRAAAEGELVETEVRLADASGVPRWVGHRTLVAARDANGRAKEAIGTALDVTPAHDLADRLRHLSTHDALTGLFNRGWFEEELERLRAGRRFPVSVVAVDLDDLKRTNDAHGHAAGDRLLRRAAMILAGAFRAEDAVARVGGDEFLVLLPATNAEAAEQSVARVRARLAEETGDAHPSLSIGHATAASAEELPRALEEADARMYADKAQRKGRAPG